MKEYLMVIPPFQVSKTEWISKSNAHQLSLTFNQPIDEDITTYFAARKTTAGIEPAFRALQARA
jgi:hypothetical protein